MALLFEALFTIGIILGILWLIGVAKSAADDRRASIAAAAEERKLADREAHLRATGEPLHCMNCNTPFLGPLTADGCPSCHLSTMVVPAAEYESKSTVVVDSLNE